MTTLAAIHPDTSFARPIRAFVAFELRRAARNRRYLLFAIGFPVLFYLLYTGVLGGDSADPTAKIGGIPWRTYFMVSMATYGAIGASLGGAVLIAQERASGWVRQLRVTPLPPGAYVLGKLAVASLVTIPAVVAVFAAGAIVVGVQLPAATWPELLIALVLGSLPFAALGLLIGYAFEADAAQGAMTMCFFGLAILGGLWAPITSFPDTLATIGRMLPSFRVADLGRLVAVGVTPDPADIAILAAYAVALGALAAWRYRASQGRAGG
jgi:ABC-2 type transport system permease protein